MIIAKDEVSGAVVYPFDSVDGSEMSRDVCFYVVRVQSVNAANVDF